MSEVKLSDRRQPFALDELAHHSLETMASDAVERLAHLLGISTNLDDPEPALIAAVERAVADLLIDRRESHDLPFEGQDT